MLDELFVLCLVVVSGLKSWTLINWRSACCWGCRRSYVETRMAQCWVCVDRSTCSYNTPLILFVLRSFLLVGNRIYEEESLSRLGRVRCPPTLLSDRNEVANSISFLTYPMNRTTPAIRWTWHLQPRKNLYGNLIWNNFVSLCISWHWSSHWSRTPSWKCGLLDF